MSQSPLGAKARPTARRRLARDRRDATGRADGDCTRRPRHDPAVGTRGGPARGAAAAPRAPVALARRDLGDARWSYLYKRRDTALRGRRARPRARSREANREDARRAGCRRSTGRSCTRRCGRWEVPLYFWFGGMAAGVVVRRARLRRRRRRPLRARSPARSRSARVVPAPVLLIPDLGRPERFLNMLRIFKPRSPMSMGAWCLIAVRRLARGGGRRRTCSGARRPAAALGGADRARRRLPRLLHRRAARLRPRCRCGRAAACSSARSSSPPRPPPARPPRGSCSSPAACRTATRRAGRSARSRPPRC